MSELTFQERSALLQMAATTREAWFSRLTDPRRDIDKECGYPCDIGIEQYKRAYERGDVAQRVVSVYPEETWAHDPKIYEKEGEGEETKFETAWNEFQRNLNVFSALLQADIQSGIGDFGVLLIGVDDGLGLDQPIPGVNADGTYAEGVEERKVLFLRSFDQSVVMVNDLETDITNPRYGLPLSYNIQFVDTSVVIATQPQNMRQVKVHWSRVIHLCDNRGNSNVFGHPRMQVVFDRLLDVKKVCGGSAEMFWKGGFPGYALETTPQPDGAIVTIDKATVKAEMDDFQNKLQRYIALENLKVTSLAPQIADPTNHGEMQIRLIALALGIPWRILMGVEVGQLAGEQDMRGWTRRLQKRREKYINPFILRPFIDRVIGIGALPKPEKVIIGWPDLNTPSDTDKATVAEKRVNAISKYMQSGGDALIPPLEFLIHILGFDEETSQAIIEAAKNRDDSMDLTPPMVEAAMVAAKAKASQPAARPVGR